MAIIIRLPNPLSLEGLKAPSLEISESKWADADSLRLFNELEAELKQLLEPLLNNEKPAIDWRALSGASRHAESEQDGTSMTGPVTLSPSPPPEVPEPLKFETSDPKLQHALRLFVSFDAQLRKFLGQHHINVETAIALKALTQVLRRAEGEQGGIPPEVLDTAVIKVGKDSPLFGLTQAGSGEVSLCDALAYFGIGAEGTSTKSGLARIVEDLAGLSGTLDDLNQTQLMELKLLQGTYTIASDLCKKLIDIVAETNKSFANQR